MRVRCQKRDERGPRPADGPVRLLTHWIERLPGGGAPSLLEQMRQCRTGGMGVEFGQKFNEAAF